VQPHKKWKRSTRRAVLWWAGLFLALQAGLAFSLDSWLGLWRDPNYAAHRDLLRRLREQHPGRPLVIVAGSSRTMNGLCPAAVPDDGQGPLLVNWGFPYQAPLDIAYRVERLLREGPRPDGVIIEVVPGLLTGKWSDPPAVPPHFLCWDDLPTAREMVPDEDVTRAWRDARLLPWFAYRHNIMDHYMPAWQVRVHRNDGWWRLIDEWGWLPNPATVPNRELQAGVLVAYSRWLKRPDVHPDQARGLRHLLATCRREGIAAAVLLMPEDPALRSCYGPGTRDSLDAFLKSQCREFGDEFIDARDWFDAEDSWSDRLHLVPDAARRFTVRLAQEGLPRLNLSSLGSHAAAPPSAHVPSPNN
jgi:hypothetical protein